MFVKTTSRTNLQRFRIKRYLTPRLIIKQRIPKDQRQVCVNVQRFFIPPLLESHFNIIDTTRFRNDLVKKKKKTKKKKKKKNKKKNFKKKKKNRKTDKRQKTEKEGGEDTQKTRQTKIKIIFFFTS